MNVCKYCQRSITELGDVKLIRPCKCTNPVCESCFQKYAICEICKESCILPQTDIMNPKDIHVYLPSYDQNFRTTQCELAGKLCIMSAVIVIMIIMIIRFLYILFKSNSKN